MKTCIKILIFILLLSQSSFAQKTISGKVLDKETEEPLMGVNMIITNTSTGTTSDINGFFELDVDAIPASLTFTYLGYEDIVVENPGTNMTVYLSPKVSFLDEVMVRKTFTKPVKNTSDIIYTGSAITESGIKLMGASANTSVYNALDFMPGVNVESNDAYGLSEKTARIRCIKNNFSGMTIEGFPNYGIMPIGARDDIYDMENMQQIAVFKGATPADLGTATGSKGGAIEIQYKRPADEFGVHVEQSMGTDNFIRTFTRVDFNLKPTQTGTFLSYSHSQSDKWKGPGQLGPRDNAAIGITQKIAKNTLMEIFANYNQIDRHDFRPLTYEQAKDINKNYKLDYNSSLTGNPADDLNYYDYNGGSFINRDVMTILSHTFGGGHKASLRYYISSEDADFEEGVKKGPNFFVFNRQRDINRTGIIPEVSGKFGNINYALGYWFESADNNASVYSSRITEGGLQAIGYSVFTVNDKKSQVHSPYIKFASSVGKINFQVGLKYFYFLDPESDRYTSVTPTELSDLPIDDLHTNDITHAALLPTFAIGFDLGTKLDAYINYGKNYMRPYMYSPIISLYVKNQQTFTDNGMTLQSIFDKWHMETSDHFDVGVRYNSEKIRVSPSVFYAIHHNVLASAYDPVVQLDYYQNVGELNAYGLDIESYFFPTDNLMLYINPTYNRMVYNNELYRKTSDGNENIGIKGNQAPETPSFFIKTGCVYSWNAFNIGARTKYIGSRYGDATNQEEISGYTLVDASITYYNRNIWKIKKLCVGVEFENIFNEKYIGMIQVSDDSVQGNASYFAGSPFSVIGKIGINF